MKKATDNIALSVTNVNQLEKLALRYHLQYRTPSVA